MKFSLFIGRFQPFHEGHKKLIDTVLAEGKKVLVACRDTEIDEQNPYTFEERIKMIRKNYPDPLKVMIMLIPDIEEIIYGRGVGWGIREIRLPDKIEKISATKIRNKQNEIKKN